MSLVRKIALSILTLLLSLVWWEMRWLTVVTVVCAWLSIWLPKLRRLIWTICSLLVMALIAFFLWRQGGASHYTNWILSTILALSLTGAALELGFTNSTFRE